MTLTLASCVLLLLLLLPTVVAAAAESAAAAAADDSFFLEKMKELTQNTSYCRCSFVRFGA